MYGCLRCNMIENVFDSPADIYISSQIPHILFKIESILQRNNINFKIQTNILFLSSSELKEVVSVISSDSEITVLEKSDIFILPVPAGKTLTPSMAFSLKNLKIWEDIFSADDLLYIISNRKLVTFFHPIIDFRNKSIHAYECLTRGINKDGKSIPPFELFTKAQSLYLQFNLDRIAREMSIENAARNNISRKIFINFIPNSIYDPKECLSTTFEAAKKFNIKPENIVFEVIQSEKVVNIEHLKSILDLYREMGFGTALDDLGSSYSSLKMLEELQPDYIKIDMQYIRNIHLDHLRQSLIKALLQVAKENNIRVIAEGIESIEEFDILSNLGVDYVQGFYFGQPASEPVKSLSRTI